VLLKFFEAQFLNHKLKALLCKLLALSVFGLNTFNFVNSIFSDKNTFVPISFWEKKQKKCYITINESIL